MDSYDVAIIGAGPIGLELAVGLKRAGVNYVHFEGGQIGQTMTWWPKHLTFFSSPERIAIAGMPLARPDQGKVTADEYLCYLRNVVLHYNLEVRTYERVVDIRKETDGFTIATQTLTDERTTHCQRIVLATGGTDAAKRLDIPGEDLPHVSHYFHDPHKYFRRRLLIVGGKNSALEAAVRCWRASADVTISYRRDTFDMEQVKRWLGPEANFLIDKGCVGFLPNTVPIEIAPGKVVLESTVEPGQRFEHETDFVLLLTGFVADMSLFKKAGVTLEAPSERPQINYDTMETSVPGIYAIGTAIAGTQQDYRIFIENAHEHVVKAASAITGGRAQIRGSIFSHGFDFSVTDIPDQMRES
jgi:thioredoxin reductase (NADPH)